MDKPYILVLYYSKTGSTAALAQYIARGIASVEGIEAKIRTVPPVSLTTEAVDQLIPDVGAPYVTLDELSHAIGLAVGSPTRFGNMAAPMKYFWDTTTEAWFKGALINKPACVFCSSSSMHGGQESTLLSMMIPLLHHGMVMTGLPYSLPELSTTLSGGTPYGATHVSGVNNNNSLSEDEKILAKALGERLAKLSLALKEI